MLVSRRDTTCPAWAHRSVPDCIARRCARRPRNQRTILRTGALDGTTTRRLEHRPGGARRPRAPLLRTHSPRRRRTRTGRSRRRSALAPAATPSTRVALARPCPASVGATAHQRRTMAVRLPADDTRIGRPLEPTHGHGGRSAFSFAPDVRALREVVVRCGNPKIDVAVEVLQGFPQAVANALVAWHLLVPGAVIRRYGDDAGNSSDGSLAAISYDKPRHHNRDNDERHEQRGDPACLGHGLHVARGVPDGPVPYEAPTVAMIRAFVRLDRSYDPRSCDGLWRWSRSSHRVSPDKRPPHQPRHLGHATQRWPRTHTISAAKSSSALRSRDVGLSLRGFEQFERRSWAQSGLTSPPRRDKCASHLTSRVSATKTWRSAGGWPRRQLRRRSRRQQRPARQWPHCAPARTPRSEKGKRSPNQKPSRSSYGRSRSRVAALRRTIFSTLCVDYHPISRATTHWCSSWRHLSRPATRRASDLKDRSDHLGAP